MQNITSHTRLTDALERQLIDEAVAEQIRLKPGKALATAIGRVFKALSTIGRERVPASGKHAMQ